MQGFVILLFHGESDLYVAVRKKLLILAHQQDKDVFTGQRTIIKYKDADARSQSTLGLLGKKIACLSTCVGAAAHTHDKAKFLT